MLTNTNPDAVLGSDHRSGVAVGDSYALLIGTDDSIETICLTRSNTGTYGAAIRRAIGCRLYAVVEVTERIDMWTDDEGMPDLGDSELVASTLNPLATLLLAEYRCIYQPYFGAALFTGRSGEHTAGLDPKHLADLRVRARAVASRPGQLETFRQRVLAAAGSG